VKHRHCVARTEHGIRVVPQNLVNTVFDFAFKAGSASRLRDRELPVDHAIKEESPLFGKTVGIFEWNVQGR
jgi:hypothetical protein